MDPEDVTLTRSELAQETSAALRTRLTGLREDERALQKILSIDIRMSPRVRQALDALDESTKRLLRTHSAAEAYAQWETASSKNVVRVKAELRRAGRLGVYWSLAKGPSVIVFSILSLILSPSLSSVAETQHIELAGGWLASFMLCYGLMFLAWAELGVFTMRAARTSLRKELGIAAAWQQRSDSVGQSIRIADKFSKKQEQREDADSSLSEVQESIANIEYVLDRRGSKSRTSIPSNVKQAVWNRDEGKCVRCGKGKEAGARLHFDHIIPYSKGGADVEENLQVLCVSCNLAKGANVE